MSDGDWTLRPLARPFGLSASPARRPDSSALYGYVLDLDDELAEGVEIRMRPSARQHATAKVLEADPGECDLSLLFGAVGSGPGLLIVDGLIAAETNLAGRTVTELLGRTDLLLPPETNEDEMIGGASTWRVLARTRIAVLDGEFLDRIRAWPQISHVLYRRSEHRATDLTVLRAISCQPKLEVRLVLLLWHLAVRWGRVEPCGLRLTLPLTHRLVGQMVGAERPSVSHAFSRLSQAGIVTGSAGDWHLRGSVADHLNTLLECGGLLRPEHSTHRSAERV
ncbi:helix-turn-helix domain-containing protein [Conexibacter sp. DBS9H8]|uniref:helix-turn-helix domain-containing protein n=1 Tax=Conexibacter sp. DBS9H8 TaxID=2937801 RepID=UPI00200E64D1|nr:helix-turn-helix domain-containing protein [Conexibacter sp. DBS9H8]